MIGKTGTRGAALLAAIALGLCCLPASADAKSAPPAGAELKALVAQVNDVFKEDIAAAKTPELKIALAKKLFAAAREDKTPASKFALLTRADDFAAEGGEIDLAFSILAETEKSFDVPAVKLKLDVAGVAALNAKTPDQQARFILMCASEINAAFANDDFASARQFSALEVSVAKFTASTQILNDALARLEVIKEVEAAGTEAKNAEALLATKPGDAESSLKVGRYLCLYKRQWAKGSAILAAGSDPALKAAAVLENSMPSSVEDKNKTGDAWWDVSTPLKGIMRRNAQARAVEYYKQTVADTPAGLSKARVEKRIAEFEQTAVSTSVVVPKGAVASVSVNVNVRERDCIGVWIVGKGPRSITINADHTASQSSNKSVTGTWELVDGEIRVTYSHGWRNHIVPKDGKFVMNSYAPKKEITDPPYETRDISKSTAATAPK